MNPKQGLMGGLMAGLGAYGGAQLGAGLGNIATSEAGSTVSNLATEASETAAKEELAKQQALQESARQQLLSSPTPQNIEAAAKFTPDYINNMTQSARDFAANSAGMEPAAGFERMYGDRFTGNNVLPVADTSGLTGMYKGAESLVTDPTAEKFKTLGGGSYMGLAKSGLAAAAPAIAATPTLNMPNISTAQKQQVVPHYRFEPGMATPTPVAGATGVENAYFPGSRYVPLSNEEAARLYPGYPAAAAGGGLMDSVVGMATGGISDAHYNLGGYSDGGRLLRGPGDGVSDSIPATIGKKQPARLADGEFVVPARIVSELGNGSTEAGARKLYAMMDRVQAARRSTVGKGKVARNSRADKYLPA
jgi:hypothetical protein